MRMKTLNSSITMVLCAGFASCLLDPSAVKAQQIGYKYEPFTLHGKRPDAREASFEFYGLGYYFGGPSFDFGNGGDAEFSDTGFGGFGIGYNITDHFGVNFEMAFGGSDLRVETPYGSVTSDTTMNSGRINLDYNLLNGPITPFVTAGLGWFYFDTEVPSGPPQAVCWWDYYYWGYVCGYVQPIYDEFDFTMNAGGGLRWDINDHLFLKAFAGVNWINFRHSGFEPAFQAGGAIGVKY